MSLVTISLWRWCCWWQKPPNRDAGDSPDSPPSKGVPQYQTETIVYVAASTNPVSADKEEAIQVRFTGEFFPEEDSWERPETAQIAESGYRYESGCVYKGEWRDGKRHGYGEMVWTETRGYKGLWVQGWPQGEGTAQLNAELSFSGHWTQRNYTGSEQLPLIPSFPQWLSAVDDGYSTL